MLLLVCRYITENARGEPSVRRLPAFCLCNLVMDLFKIDVRTTVEGILRRVIDAWRDDDPLDLTTILIFFIFTQIYPHKLFPKRSSFSHSPLPHKQNGTADKNADRAVFIFILFCDLICPDRGR